jgi:hypothetical protein
MGAVDFLSDDDRRTIELVDLTTLSRAPRITTSA